MIFVWNERCQQAFDEHKKLLSESPFLGNPDHKGQYIVDTDGNNIDRDPVVVTYLDISLSRPK